MILLLATPQPTDFWRDAIWQSWGVIAGTILAITGIIVTYWIFREGTQKKEIAYAVISDVYLLNVNKDIKDDVEIHFRGKVIENLSVLVIKIWNSGNTAVESNDYDEPISFHFGQRSAIEVGEIETSPDNIDVNFILSGLNKFQRYNSSIATDGFLLNPKEYIIINFLLIGLKGEITAKARIVNGKLVRKSSDSGRGKRSLLFYLFLLIVIGILFLMPYIFPTIKSVLDKVVEYITASLAMIGFIASMEVIEQFLSKRRRH